MQHMCTYEPILLVCDSIKTEGIKDYRLVDVKLILVDITSSL